MAWDYTSELMREPSSHIMSALLGDKYVPDPSERAAWAVFERWLNTQVKGGFKKVTRPWAGKKPTYNTTPSSSAVDKASAARREKLAQLF